MWRNLVLVLVLCVSSRAHADLAFSQQVVDQTCDFFEWALDLQMTQAQRDDAKVLLHKFWTAKDKKDIDGVEQILAMRAKLMSVDAAARAKVQPQVQQGLLDGMRKEPNEPAAKWLQALYDNAHVSLVPGQPALTRQSVDALAEMLAFVYGEASKGKPLPIDKKYKDELAKALVQNWANVPDQTKLALARVPGTWAALRMQWAVTPERDRKTLRVQWAQSLAPQNKQDPQNLAAQMYAERARHQIAMRAIDAIGCAAGCNYHYEYRWEP